MGMNPHTSAWGMKHTISVFLESETQDIASEDIIKAANDLQISLESLGKTVAFIGVYSQLQLKEPEDQIGT